MAGAARGQLGKGQALGDYEISSVAGTGGMGVVYKATQRSLDRVVALKVIREDIASAPEYRERFLREARLAASVDHPNVVTVYDVGDQADQLFLVMQWIDGEDLKKLIEQSGRLAPERAVAIACQLAGALDAVHGVAGLVHRDVKPANVLVRQVGGTDHAYLTDFGVAKPSDAVEHLTQTGWVVGTTGYLSPEQIRGREPGPRSDLYALGCVFFEAMTGSPPFSGANEMATRWAHANDPRPAASTVLTALGTRYDHFLSIALAVDPEHRFATGREFAAALAAAHDGHAATTRVAPTHAPTVIGPPTPAPPPMHTPPPLPPAYAAYGYATPVPGSARASRSGNPLALILLAIVALSGLGVGVLAAAGVFTHNTPAQASSKTAKSTTTGRATHHAEPGSSATPTRKTTTGSTSTDSTSTALAPLAVMHAPGGAYTVLIPSNWSYQSPTVEGGEEDLWTAPNPNEKLEVLTTGCGSCVTASSGGPDPSLVGTPQGTVSTFVANSYALGFEAYTSGDPYPDNGIDVITTQGSSPTGSAQINLWLPNSLHTTATRMLNSFSLFKATFAGG